MNSKKVLYVEINITNLEGNTLETINISETGNTQNLEQNNTYLHAKLSRDFRDAINSPIFFNDSKYLSQYNLCCAVVDRLDTCVEKLNSYGDYPDSEEDFMVFMMFSCMLKDAINELFKRLKITLPKESRNYFNTIYRKSPVYNPDKEEPTDDKFFEYLRSLMFAHPCETTRANFLKKNEIQYSPWVIVNDQIRIFDECKDAVGVRVYTNMSEEILDIVFPFFVLKEYVRSKYEVLPLATQHILQQISEVKKQWEKVKINRNQSPIDILKEIEEVLASRYSSAKHEIVELIQYLCCELSDESNRVSVEKFKSEIINNISALCDATDALDDASISNICDNIIKNPKKMHGMALYQMGKIFCYLSDQSYDNVSVEDIGFGLIQAKYFANGFAKKWVTINEKTMSFGEIKLLVRTACYLERKEQESK